MRTGVLERPSAEPGTHACWRFDDPAAFREAAVAFLSEGATLGERLLYVADGSVEELRSDMAALADVDGLVSRGALFLQPVRELYEPDGAFEAGRQLAAYQQLIESSLREGYTGLRVAADATALVTTDEDRRRFMAYELAVDRVMANHPMTAMCAYDGRIVGPPLSELFAVHPMHHGGHDLDPGFRAFYVNDTVRLAGVFDLGNRELFQFVLDSLLATEERHVAVDLSTVTFMDVGALRLLDEFGADVTSSGRTFDLKAVPRLVRRCCEMLSLETANLGAVSA